MGNAEKPEGEGKPKVTYALRSPGNDGPILGPARRWVRSVREDGHRVWIDRLKWMERLEFKYTVAGGGGGGWVQPLRGSRALRRLQEARTVATKGGLSPARVPGHQEVNMLKKVKKNSCAPDGIRTRARVSGASHAAARGLCADHGIWETRRSRKAKGSRRSPTL